MSLQDFCTPGQRSTIITVVLLTLLLLAILSIIVVIYREFILNSKPWMRLENIILENYKRMTT